MDSIFFQSAHFILPFTIAVLGFGIYIFGFQSVKEPDYSYINNIVIGRKKKQVPIKKNGIVQLNKVPASPQPIKKKVEQKSSTIGKENAQPPKKPKTAIVEDSDDIDQGDWLPAPVRGASNRKAAANALAAKQQQNSPVKKDKDNSSSNKKKFVLKEVSNEEVKSTSEAKVAHEKSSKKKDVLKEEIKVESVESSKNKETVEEKEGGIANKTVNSKNVANNRVEDEIHHADDFWEETKSRGAKKKARAKKD